VNLIEEGSEALSFQTIDEYGSRNVRTELNTMRSCKCMHLNELNPE